MKFTPKFHADLSMQSACPGQPVKAIAWVICAQLLMRYGDYSNPLPASVGRCKQTYSPRVGCGSTAFEKRLVRVLSAAAQSAKAGLFKVFGEYCLPRGGVLHSSSRLRLVPTFLPCNGPYP